VRKSVVLGRRMDEQLAAGDIGDWDLYRLLDAAPVESVVFALGHSESDGAQERFRRYLGVLRRRQLRITGADVIALGARQGPDVGKVLETVRRGRIEDRIGPGRQAELAAAQSYIEADNAPRVEEQT